MFLDDHDFITRPYEYALQKIRKRREKKAPASQLKIDIDISQFRACGRMCRWIRAYVGMVVSCVHFISCGQTCSLRHLNLD